MQGGRYWRASGVRKQVRANNGQGADDKALPTHLCRPHPAKVLYKLLSGPPETPVIMLASSTVQSLPRFTSNAVPCKR